MRKGLRPQQPHEAKRRCPGLGIGEEMGAPSVAALGVGGRCAKLGAPGTQRHQLQGPRSSA
eukprot:15452221-Alexandrium_andersonii.AAC.1